jgi:hypothetical protein
MISLMIKIDNNDIANWLICKFHKRFSTIAYKDSRMGQTLTSNKRLNATLGSMHLSYNAQHEKKINFFLLYLHND